MGPLFRGIGIQRGAMYSFTYSEAVTVSMLCSLLSPTFLLCIWCPAINCNWLVVTPIFRANSSGTPQTFDILATVYNFVHTAGLPIRYPHTKNQFADKPEGLRHFQDRHWKALGEENSDLPGLSFRDQF